jgi:hypothetical protein
LKIFFYMSITNSIRFAKIFKTEIRNGKNILSAKNLIPNHLSRASKPNFFININKNKIEEIFSNPMKVTWNFIAIQVVYFLLCMFAYLAEGLVAFGASVGLFAAVGAQVRFECAGARVRLAADAAEVGARVAADAALAAVGGGGRGRRLAAAEAARAAAAAAPRAERQRRRLERFERRRRRLDGPKVGRERVGGAAARVRAGAQQPLARLVVHARRHALTPLHLQTNTENGY